MDIKWMHRYMSLAKEVSTWSKDPSSKIGAVAISELGQILSTGYNGFPRGILDSEERLNNRDLKYKYVVHGEMNLIYNATYTGVSLKGAYVFVYGLPVCPECAKGLIQVGVQTVCITSSSLKKETGKTDWGKLWDTSLDLFDECGVSVIVLDGY